MMRNRSFTTAVLCGVLAVLTASSASAEALDQRLKQAMTHAVCERNGFPPEQVEITMHRTRISARFTSATHVTVSLPEFDDALGPVTGRAEFTADGVVLGSMPVPVRVDVYDSVLVTTRKLSRHQTIEPGDLTWDYTEISRMVEWARSDIDSVVGRRTTRTISAGSIVDGRWIENIPLVQRGDRVRLEYESGGVRVTTNATAMEDGYRQQRIRVRTEYAKRLIDVVVTGSGTVCPAL